MLTIMKLYDYNVCQSYLNKAVERWVAAEKITLGWVMGERLNIED